MDLEKQKPTKIAKWIEIREERDLLTLSNLF